MRFFLCAGSAQSSTGGCNGIGWSAMHRPLHWGSFTHGKTAPRSLDAPCTPCRYLMCASRARRNAQRVGLETRARTGEALSLTAAGANRPVRQEQPARAGRSGDPAAASARASAAAARCQKRGGSPLPRAMPIGPKTADRCLRAASAERRGHARQHAPPPASCPAASIVCDP